MKMVVYSAVFGGYDPGPHNILPFKRPGIDFIWISDKKPDNLNGWIFYHHNKYVSKDKYKFARTNRFFKLQPHKTLLADYDINVYIDGNKHLTNIDCLQLLCHNLMESNMDAVLFKHQKRKFVYQEVNRVISRQCDNPDIVRQQYREYIMNGFKDDQPLIVANVMLRKNTPAMRGLLNCWWNEVITKSYRDQISFPYALWKCPINYKLMETVERDCFTDTFKHKDVHARNNNFIRVIKD